MTRWVLGLSYLGHPYSGWQTQPSGQAVQDVLESALREFLGAPVKTVCAGRTDAGVHALQQVVHIDAPVARSEMAWVRGLSAHLPDSIRVHWALPAPRAEFHARFDAQARRYVYLLWQDRVLSPFWADRAGWSFRALDVAQMQMAAPALLGTHDFSSFRAAGCQARSPVRTLHRLDIMQRGKLIAFVLEANAFLHHMVRNIVGALVLIGQGRMLLGHEGSARDGLEALLQARDRRLGAPTFSAAGLYFAGVRYPDALLPCWPDLPSQAVWHLFE